MNDQIEEIKQKTDIVSLIGQYLKLSKAGKHYKALCPFHSEKTPSFTVSPELQIFKCFGCGESGDAFSFLEKYEGMEFGEALRFLAEKTGIALKKTNFSQLNEKEVLYEINSKASQYYHYILTKHKAGALALKYILQDRNLSKETVTEFFLGYAPDNKSALFNFLLSKKYKLFDILRSGLIVEVEKNGKKLYFDRFRGRVIFPLFDHRGNCVGLAGRILPDVEKSLPKGMHLAKYINSPETTVYHKSQVLYGLNKTRSEIRKKNQAIIVEGEVDLLSVFQAGFKNIVAIKGTALTIEQVQLLSRLCSQIILALDSDLAGDMAARRGIVLAQNAGLNISVLVQKSFKDPDEFVRNDPNGFAESLKKTIGVWDFLIESVFRKHDSLSGEGKALVSREIIPILGLIDDLIVQAHYVGMVAQKLGVDFDVVSRQLGKQTQPQKTVAETKESPGLLRQEMLERDLLGLAFTSDPLILTKEEYKSLFLGTFSKRAIEFLSQYLSSSSFKLSYFILSLPDEMKPQISEVIIKSQIDDDSKNINEQIKLVTDELRKEIYRKEAHRLTKLISQQEKDGDTQSVKKTQKKLSELIQKQTQLAK